jgi:hypothetical protein
MPWTNPETFTAGQTLTAASMNIVSENTRVLYASQQRLAYIARGTSGADNYSASATSVSGASDVFSSDITFTADGTSTYWVTFYCPLVIVGATASSSVSVSLTDGGSTEVQRVALFGPAGVGASALIRTPYAPASGSRSLNIRAWNVASTGTLTFGGTYAPGYLAVHGPDIT